MLNLGTMGAGHRKMIAVEAARRYGLTISKDISALLSSPGAIDIDFQLSKNHGPLGQALRYAVHVYLFKQELEKQSLQLQTLISYLDLEIEKLQANAKSASTHEMSQLRHNIDLLVQERLKLLSSLEANKREQSSLNGLYAYLGYLSVMANSSTALASVLTSAELTRESLMDMLKNVKLNHEGEVYRFEEGHEHTEEAVDTFLDQMTIQNSPAKVARPLLPLNIRRSIVMHGLIRNGAVNQRGETLANQKNSVKATVSILDAALASAKEHIAATETTLNEMHEKYHIETVEHSETEGLAPAPSAPPAEEAIVFAAPTPNAPNKLDPKTMPTSRGLTEEEIEELLRTNGPAAAA